MIATNEPHESRYFHCHLAEEIEEKAVQIGQLARAAIWYFAGTVLHFEAQRDARASRGGRTAVLIPGNPTERM